jgi:hypothetical protein
MEKHQVVPIPESQKSFLVQLTRDFRAGLSYISFYSIDSPFVVQAIQKLYKDLQRLLMAVDSALFYARTGKMFLNDCELPDFEDLLKLLQDKNNLGVEITKGLTQVELTAWLRKVTLPFEEIANASGEKKESNHIRLLPQEDFVTVLKDETATATEIPISGVSTSSSLDALPDVPFPTMASTPTAKGLTPASLTAAPDILEVEGKTGEALLSFVAEAWQFSQMQKRGLSRSPEAAELTKSFEKIFDRLLDRMEKSSPEFKNIYQWFKTSSGELMEDQVITAMFPLMEVAVKNNWTAILFDPATEGLVNDCLTHWGANGKHELLEKTVIYLAEGLNGDTLERHLALTHLRDARPWVGTPELLEKVLGRLNSLLANETFPALYQSALLLAWDLMEPAMEKGLEQPVLTLLSTLHFHADEDITTFPERAHIARHWLFERSTPELTRRFVRCAYQAGQLNHYPLLGEMAAPLLLKDFLRAPSTEKPGYLQLFTEMKEPIRSVLAESLADTQDEADVRQIIPILRTCGVDPGLSLQLCSWVAKGGRELKLNLIGMIEEMGDAAGGPALRLALFDDSEEIASLAARVIGKIHFIPGLPVLLKAAKIRETRFPENEVFLTAVCQSLGDLAQPDGISFLQDIARKKPLLRGKNFSLTVRLEAIQALTKINRPETWHFLETLTEEKNPKLQEALDKIIHNLHSS